MKIISSCEEAAKKPYPLASRHPLYTAEGGSVWQRTSAYAANQDCDVVMKVAGTARIIFLKTGVEKLISEYDMLEFVELKNAKLVRGVN